MNPVVAATRRAELERAVMWWQRSLRRSCVAAGALIVASCSTGSAGGSEVVEFVEVEEAEDWEDVAVRLGCSDPVSVDEAADHLRSSNPIPADVGIERGQVLSYDPDRLLLVGCGERFVMAREDETADADDTRDASGATADEIDSSQETVHEPANQVETMRTFREDFETDASMSRFEFSVHHPVIWAEPVRQWMGDHDLSCDAPPTTRTITLPGDRKPDDGKHYDGEIGDVVYRCAPRGEGTGHLMTTFNTIGYAQVGFSPLAVFDGVSQVCWDQNMTDLGIRKWTQLVVVPVEDFERNDRRLDYVSPDLDEGPASLGTPLPDDALLVEVRGGSSIVHSDDERDANYAGYKNADKKRRFTVCVSDIGEGLLEVEFEREDAVDRRVHAGSFPLGPSRVIFQDDTYNAPKSPPELEVDDPFTWHWDNISVATN